MILLPENMTANTPPDTVRQVKCHNLFQFDIEKTNRSLHHFTSHTTNKTIHCLQGANPVYHRGKGPLGGTLAIFLF